MGHNPAVLAAKTKLAELGSSSTRCTELRLDHLIDEEGTKKLVVEFHIFSKQEQGPTVLGMK